VWVVTGELDRREGLSNARSTTLSDNPRSDEPSLGNRSPLLRSVLTIALVSLALASAMVIRNLASVDWDPTLFTAFGEKALPTREYGEARLGDVYLRINQGHDGKFFFVQANDPWVLDPQDNALVLDLPLYRSQRMLYPLLAGGGGLFTPAVIVWAMIVVNVLALAGGSVATALVARNMGMSAWWGLAFVLNVGLISEMDIGGSGVVAAAAVFGAIAFFLHDRVAWGITFLVFASLARETMLIAALGIAVWFWWYQREHRRAVWVFVVPLSAVVGWAAYIRFRIGFGSGASQGLGLPLAGFWEAFQGWLDHPSLDMLVGVIMLALVLLFARRALMSRRILGWAFIGLAPLAFILTEPVWRSYFDITRVLAPIITAYVILLFAPPAPAIERTGVRP
jgi:hypothetical protein